MLRMVTNSNVR